MKVLFGSCLVVAIFAGFIMGAPAQSQTAAPALVSGSGSAAMLTGTKGMTLYVYDKDVSGKSNCNGRCATNWPPLSASASDRANSKWTVFTRDDGSLQWAYDGKAVYYWKNDKVPGDTTGDGVGGKWHVARPAAP